MASMVKTTFTENSFGDLSYSFLEPVPNYLTCIICYGLLKEPVATDCCEKMFCCEHSSRTERICPACRHTPLSVSRNRGIDSIVKGLKVFCLNHREGCQWSGHLCFEPKHRVGTCGHESVPCEKECGMNVQRRFMKDHLTKECLLRKVDCEFCDYKGTAAEVASHLEICTEYLIACPHGCELQLPRKGLNDHSSTCLEAPVSCPFAGAGCNTMPVKRKDLAGHLETSVVAHLLLLASCNQCLTEEVIELRKEKEELLERSRVEVAELEAVKTELQQLKDKVNRLVENERKNDAKSSKDHLALLNECEGSSLYERRDVAIPDSQAGVSEGDEDTYEYGSEENCSIESSWMDELNCLADSDSFLPVILRYEDVQSDITTAGTWISPQFYDNGGYCMSLCVTPKGINQAKGRFVSVQMQLQYGVNDGELYWPYWDTLEVEILNPWANCNHCRKTMDFNSFPIHCVKQPDVYSENEPWGILRFLNHHQLHDYLLDDTLYFRVKHVWQA